ncbi:MAG: hypothetical protein IT369_12775 [Candidatus Latescibacteria bacterium]|nr:hypothetical protein [Candidatus Latescibacterota bacterium]
MLNSLKGNLRFVLAFAGACLVGVYIHEIGHAVAGWVQGIPVFPTPAKEYILLDQVEWDQETWISLGGVIGTVLVVLGTLLWYVRSNRFIADAILAGVLLTPCLYTVRFLLVGRGHDALEWQAAQSALGLAPAGHAVDLLFLGLLLAGIAVWIVRRHSSLRLSSVVRVLGLVVGGIALLVILQTTNNALFDQFFPKTTTMDVPAGLDPR